MHELKKLILSDQGVNAKQLQLFDEQLLILHNLAHLHFLNLQSCYNISNIGLCHVLKQAPVLHTLILEGCDNITGMKFAFSS